MTTDASNNSPMLTESLGAQVEQSTKPLVWLVSAAFFMQLLDSTIVNTVVPVIADALQVAPLQMRSALTSYVLTLAVFSCASPWLCDRFGTRRVFAVAISLFSLGSLLCGLAQTLEQLVAARILQGLGGAALLPVGRYVVARSIKPPYFVNAMSMVMTIGIAGSVLGPLLGGLLTQFGSWRWVFLVNVPIGLLGIWMTRRTMPDYRLARASRFDIPGFVLFAAAAALLLIASELVEYRERAAWIGASLLLALICALLYVRHSRRTEHPIADLSLLRIRNVSVSLLGNLFTRLGISGMLLVVALLLQLGLGWSPLMTGLMMVPQALGSILAKQFVGRLLAWLGYRRFLWGNTLAVAASIAGFMLLQRDSSSFLIALLMFVYGALMGMQYVAMSTLIFVDLDDRHTAMAASMAATMQYLSMSFGIALASLVMSAFLHGSVPDDYVVAFRWTVALLAIITALASGIFGCLPRAGPPGATAHK